MKLFKIALLAAASVSLFGCSEKKGISEVSQAEWQNICLAAAVKQEYTTVTLYKRTDASPVEFKQKTAENNEIIEKCSLGLLHSAQGMAMGCKLGKVGEINCQIDVNSSVDTQSWQEMAIKDINERIRSQVSTENRAEYTTMPVKKFTVGRP